MTAPESRDGRSLGWVGVALVTVAAAFAALIEVLLVPVYVGGTVVPVAVVLALASNIALPRLAAALVARPLAVAAPFVVWLVITFGFGVIGRPEGDVILPGGGTLVYVSYGVLLGGALAGTITVVLTMPSRTARPGQGRVSAGTGRGSPRSTPPGRR